MVYLGKACDLFFIIIVISASPSLAVSPNLSSLQVISAVQTVKHCRYPSVTLIYTTETTDTEGLDQVR